MKMKGRSQAITMRPGETGGRDVRRRLRKAGHDGVRIEYAGGAVDFVAFSNRNVRRAKRQNQDLTMRVNAQESEVRHGC